MAKFAVVKKRKTTTTIKCPRCHGDSAGDSGRVRYKITGFGNSKYKDCPTCSGNGLIKVTGTPPFTECPTCGGTGKNNPGSRCPGTCNNCSGSGVVQSDLDEY